jgi:hypothetical protein
MGLEAVARLLEDGLTLIPRLIALRTAEGTAIVPNSSLLEATIETRRAAEEPGQGRGWQLSSIVASVLPCNAAR